MNMSPEAEARMNEGRAKWNGSPKKGKAGLKVFDATRDKAFDAECIRRGLPEPVQQYPYGCGYRIDFLWDWLAVFVENGLRPTRQMRNACVIEGFAVLVVTAAEVADGRIFEIVKAALEADA